MGTCEAVGEAEGALPQPHHEVGGHPVAQPRFDKPAGEEEGDDDEPDDVAREGTAPREALQEISAQAGGEPCPLSGDSNRKVCFQGGCGTDAQSGERKPRCENIPSPGA